jgi:hypothetical protein
MPSENVRFEPQAAQPGIERDDIALIIYALSLIAAV